MDVMVVFPTTHLTLKAEKTLERQQIRHRTVMKPRKISSDCGLALRIAEDDVEECRKTLVSADLTPVRFFRESADGWKCFLKVEEQTD